MPHILDRPMWNALTSRQAHLTSGDGRAVRLDAAFGPFGGLRDASLECQTALADLVGTRDAVVFIDIDAAPTPTGLRLITQEPLNQMVLERAPTAAAAVDLVDLTDDDAAEMRALTHLTKPGPFAKRTHELGDFVGVKINGQIAAMAGERMKPVGFTEVSAVCTHPDHRGRGYGAALTRRVAERIQARGETPFLHVFPHNTPAIAVYEQLGFVLRKVMALTVLARPASD